MNNLEALNALVPGWTEAPGGLVCNPAPNGGIIDKVIGSDEWFVVFNDDRAVLDGFPTRADAIEAFASSRRPSIQSDLLSPLLKAQQSTKSQPRFSFDADNLPLFAAE